MVPPISALNDLQLKLNMIQNLIQIEMASRIILGAHKQSIEINPLEYCHNAMGVKLEPLNQMTTEFEMIKNVCENTKGGCLVNIQNIFRV